MENGERKLKLTELRYDRDKIQEKISELECGCPHNIVKEGMGAHCNVCGNSFGWWCPKSPTNLCKYTDDMDSCDYCGHPEERK